MAWISVRAAGAALAALNSALAACTQGPADTEPPDICRPADIEPAELSIGELTLAPGRFDAALHSAPGLRGYEIAITLSGQDAEALSRLTARHLGEPLVLKIGDEEMARPIVRTPILDGRVRISGDFTRAEAERLVLRLSPACEEPPAPAETPTE